MYYSSYFSVVRSTVVVFIVTWYIRSTTPHLPTAVRGVMVIYLALCTPERFDELQNCSKTIYTWHLVLIKICTPEYDSFFMKYQVGIVLLVFGDNEARPQYLQ